MGGPQQPKLSELIRSCSERSDEPAWDALVTYLQPIVVRAVWRAASRSGNPTGSLVEDLTQEAFLKLCGNQFELLRRQSVRSDQEIRGYVGVIVQNLVRDHFRHESAEKRAPPGGFVDPARFDDDIGESHDVDETERELLLDQIDAILIGHLPAETVERDRRIFWMHYRLGMSARAISAVPGLGLRIKGVESRLFQLRVLVKENVLATKGISAEETFS